MAATASIIIEVQDGQATAALQRVSAEGTKIGAALQPVQRISEQTFNNIEHGALKARESAALLGEEFGVKIPRALRGTIAEASLIGPIFTAAFSGLAIVGFIQIAVEAGKKIAEVTANMMGWGEEAKKSMDAQVELNKVFIETTDKIEKLQEAYRLIGLHGLPLLSEKQKIANEDLGAAKKRVAELTAEFTKLNSTIRANESLSRAGGLSSAMNSLFTGAVPIPLDKDELAKVKTKIDDVVQELALAQEKVRGLSPVLKNAAKEFDTTFAKDRAEEIKKIAKATEEASAKLEEMASAARRGGLTGEQQITADALAQIEAVEKIFSKEPMLAAQAAAAVAAIHDEASRKRIKLLTDEADKRFKIEDEEQLREEEDARQHAEKLRRMEDETINIERQAAIAIAPPWARANATIIADYQARMDKIREMQKTGDLDSEHAARQAAAAWTDAFAKMRDKLAGDLETLFDNITSGNIGKFFLTQFKHLVFEMVATWILGMQQMRGASQQSMGSGGGILGAIFGGIFGGGGGGGGGGGQGGIGNIPGVITNFGGGGNGDFGGETGMSGPAFPGLAGIALSAGMGGGPGTTLPSGAGGAGGAIGALGGPLAGFMAKIFSHGAGPISGAGLAALGIGLLSMSVGKGGVLGALGGAAGGALLGFSIGGPIGAIIGGIAGLIGGLLHHGTKKARLAIEEDIKRKAATIEDSYNLFQSDWTSSRDALEQLRQQGVDALKQAGVKDIARSRVGHVDQWIDKAEKEIDLTQAERNRRAALTFGPAQFRLGGFVGPNLGAPAPAWFAGTAMHFAYGGAVPAMLHEGEYVMRPEAVARWGRGRLDRMNSGGGGGGDIVINGPLIHADKIDDAWLRNGGAQKIMVALRRARLEGAV